MYVTVDVGQYRPVLWEVSKLVDVTANSKYIDICSLVIQWRSAYCYVVGKSTSKWTNLNWPLRKIDNE